MAFRTIIMTAVLLVVPFGTRAGEGKRDASMVRLTLRDGRELLGRIQTYQNGAYRLSQAGGKTVSVAATDLRTMVMAPETNVVIPKRKMPRYKVPTEREILLMAIEDLRKERKEDRRKRMEATKDDMSQMGFGHIVSRIGEDVQDNLLDFLAKDKELQNILLDDQVQQKAAEKDYMSLFKSLAKDERVLNMMRNPGKVKKLMGAALGDEDDK